MLLAVAATVLFGATAAACAQERDHEAPTLAVRTDRDAPHYTVGISADPVAVALGDYELYGEVVAARVHGFRLEFGWSKIIVAQGAAVGIVYRLWPLSEGLSGPYLGPLVRLGIEPGEQAPALLLTVGGELGLQYVWRGIVVGAGARLLHRPTSLRIAKPTIGALTATLGYAWM